MATKKNKVSKQKPAEKTPRQFQPVPVMEHLPEWKGRLLLGFLDLWWRAAAGIDAAKHRFHVLFGEPH